VCFGGVFLDFGMFLMAHGVFLMHFINNLASNSSGEQKSEERDFKLGGFWEGVNLVYNPNNMNVLRRWKDVLIRLTADLFGG